MDKILKNRNFLVLYHNNGIMRCMKYDITEGLGTACHCNIEVIKVCGRRTWTIQKVTVVVSAWLIKDQWSPSSTTIFSAMTELVVVGLWFHLGHGILGISLYPWQERVPPSVGPSTKQRLRSAALAGPRVALYGCVAGWLALRSARGISPDGSWNSGSHGAENPIKKWFQNPALRRWSAPVHQGTQAKPLCTSITPKTKSLHVPLSYSLHASIPPFLAFIGEDYKPNRIWSVAPGGLWPSLVK